MQTPTSQSSQDYSYNIVLRDLDTLAARLAGLDPLLRPTTLHESLLPLLDQAASQIDVFLVGTTPLVYSVPDVPAVQADGRDLKNRVLLLRQQAGAGQPAAVLKQTLNSMIGEYQDAFNRWNQIATTTRLLNPPRLSLIGESLNRVEQLINQA